MKAWLTHEIVWQNKKLMATKLVGVYNVSLPLKIAAVSNMEIVLMTLSSFHEVKTNSSILSKQNLGC